MSQPNLFMIPIDESILLPMESLDQHLADSSKPNIIAPILRNILLQYGEPPFEVFNYSETFPQEPMELAHENSALSQEQMAPLEANILTPLENIALPLGTPPVKNESHDGIFENQIQEIAFIRRSTSEKRPLETQSTEHEINNVDKEIKRKPLKRSKMSIIQIAEKLAMTRSEIKEPMPSTSAEHNTKSKEYADQSTASKKKGKAKKPSKRKEISKDHDKGAKKKKTKNDSLNSDKEPKKKKLKKNPVDKESEKTKAPEKTKDRKTTSKKRKKSSKKSKDLPLQVKESSEKSVDVKEETRNSKGKETVKRRSGKDDLLKSEEESNILSSSPAKKPRKTKLDISDPIYLEPFKYGWIREVVYRAMKDKRTEVRKADTYYYSPEGKKFRTRKEMIETLSGHDHLTQDHFIYYPRPIGINDCTKEIVRDSFTTTVLQKKGSLKKAGKNSRKPASRKKSNSQEDNNESLNNSQPNIEIIPEKVEDTYINNSELKEKSTLDETNDNEATSDDIIDTKPSVRQDDTTTTISNFNTAESNSLKKSEKSVELDNGENLENHETLTERNSPKLKLNSLIQSQSNQHNTESKNVFSEERVFKNDNLSSLLTNMNQTTENTENQFLNSFDLVDRLHKEIKSSSFDVIERVDLNKEYEKSDIQRKINDYSDDSNQSDYKLELDPVPEKNLEELNSSFSEKMFISETVMKNNETENINKSLEEKNSLQTNDETAAKNSLSNFDFIKSIDTENEVSKESSVNKVSVSGSFLSSLDLTKVIQIVEQTNSINEIKTENWITGEASQNNLNCTNNIQTEATPANSTSDNESLEISTNLSETAKVSFTDGKTTSEKEKDIENLIIEQTLQTIHDCVKSIEAEEESAADSKSDDISLSTNSSDSIRLSVADGKNTSQKVGNPENLIIEPILHIITDCAESIEAEETSTDSQSDGLLEISTNTSVTTRVSVTDEKTTSLTKMDNENLITEQNSQSNVGCTEITNSLVQISHHVKLEKVEPENASTSLNLMNEEENTDTCDTITHRTSDNLLYAKSIDSTINALEDLKPDNFLIPGNPLMLSKAADVISTVENLPIENKSESNLGCTESVNIETSKDLNPNENFISKNCLTSTDLKNVSVADTTDEKDSQYKTDTVTSTAYDSSNKNSENNEFEILHDLKSDELPLLKNPFTLPVLVKVSTVGEETNFHNNPDDNNLTANNILQNKNDQTSTINTPMEITSSANKNSENNEFEISHDLKSDELPLLKNPFALSIPVKVSAVGEETNFHNNPDDDNLTANNILQNKDDQTSTINTPMEITSRLSQNTLSTTLSVISTDSSVVSSNTSSFTNSNSNSDISPVTFEFIGSSAMLTRSSDSAIFTSLSSNSDHSPITISSNNTKAASSSNLLPKVVSERTSPIETSVISLVSTRAAVTDAKIISSSETLPMPLHTESDIEKLIGLSDTKDSFDDVKTLAGGIKKVDQGLYNLSESFSNDSAENIYLVNTEGNTFSFTTASFKQSNKLSSNKEIGVSQFKDDINCIKTIAESIKTLNVPGDLTSKQYLLTSPDILTNETMKKNNSSNEVKIDNINLKDVKQIPSEEENFDIKPCCSKDNISKTDTIACIQIEKSPSIVISQSKTIWLESNNTILNKNKKLVSEINQSSNIKKMSTDLMECELSNLSEISDSTSCNALSLISREDTVKSMTSNSEYHSTASNSQEFVRSQSYEYQSSARDEDSETFEHLIERTDNLEDTISTISGSSNEDISTEHSNLCESGTVYEDYLVSNEFSEIIDKLAEKSEVVPDTLGVKKAVELHNDLCEFIKLPPTEFIKQNPQLISNEQQENKSNEVKSIKMSAATKKTAAKNNSNNVAVNLIEKETDANQAIKASNLPKLNTLSSPKLLKNKESNTRKVADENIYPILIDVPAAVSNCSIENDFDNETNNLSDINLQKLAFANEAVAEGRYSFECSPEILVELNNLLQMSDENVKETNQSVNLLSPQSTKLSRENSKLKDISNSPRLSDSSRTTPSMKPLNQSTPLLNSKREKKKINFQSKHAYPHSMVSFCAGYTALKHIFEYLNFEDLLIAMDVCTVWKEVAQQRYLWKTIRIRNSQLTQKLADVLQKYGTEHLLVVEEDSSNWKNFIKVLPKIKSLRVIELCPCPAIVFEEIVKNCPQLTIVNALSLQDKSFNVHSLQNLSNPQKLQLRGVSNMSMEGDLSFLSGFSNLTHLSLRSIKNLGKKNVHVLRSLKELEFLELGECSEFKNTFGSTILVELKNLKRLRLEKVEGPDCCADILISVSRMEKLTELELINIEVTKIFLTYLPKCQDIKKLLIIPKYGRRMAFINNVIMKCTTKLQNLERFVWGIPEEFVKRTRSFTERPYDDCISVLKPVPFQKLLDNIERDYIGNQGAVSIDSLVLKMMPLHILKSLYAHVLPSTEVDILKIPSYAIWNLTIT